MFWRNVLPLSSRLRSKPSKKQARSMFLQNIGGLLWATQHYIPEDNTFQSLLWEPQIQKSYFTEKIIPEWTEHITPSLYCRVLKIHVYFDLTSGYSTELDSAFFLKAYSFIEKFSHQVVKFICISQVEVVFAIFKSMKPENKAEHCLFRHLLQKSSNK
jgi:hypothetical protein